LILVKCDRCGEMIPDNEDYFVFEFTKETGDEKEHEKESYDICHLCYSDFSEWMKKIHRSE